LVALVWLTTNAPAAELAQPSFGLGSTHSEEAFRAVL